MKKNTIKMCFLLALGFVSTLMSGQIKSNQQLTPSGHIRCYTTENEAALRAENPNRATSSDFEAWIAPKIAEIKAERAAMRNINAAPTTVYKIPVVIHIIHNGDAVGSGENISDAQALSQITVLNQDFRRMISTPGYNTNPVGADLEIEFVMAKRAPNGTASTGIDRVNTGVAQYTSRANVETMKQATVWDTTKYMNMWTVSIGGGTAQWNGVLGYAQFPTNAGLIGLDNNYDPATTTEHLTDGLVMRYNAFGSIALAPSGSYIATYNRGRTATHEIGHWAGLRHIWGDGNCSVDDFCNDTPNAGAANYGCPTGTNSCPEVGVDMIENYMDYTDDTCMNIFTQDQKNRVHAVFLNGDRRNTLLYSDALVPVGLALDGGVSLESDGVDQCNLGLYPKVRLKNYGSTTITSAQITYSLDNVNVQTYNYSGSLATGASVVITLPNILYFTAAQHNLYLNLNAVNGTTDLFADNDATGKKVLRPNAVVGNTVTFNLQLDSYGTEISWTLKNGAGGTVDSGGSYPDAPPAPALISRVWNLSPNTCYTFTINDTYGDGLSTGAFYKALDGSGQTIFSGGGFKTTFSNKFIINALGVDKFEFASLNVYPNPNKGNFTVELQSDSSSVINVSVTDLRGRQIFDRKFVNNGTFNQNINLENTQSGVYLVTITDGVKKTVKKIVIE